MSSITAVRSFLDWLEGFTDNLDGPPSAKQWDKFLARAAAMKEAIAADEPSYPQSISPEELYALSERIARGAAMPGLSAVVPLPSGPPVNANGQEMKVSLPPGAGGPPPRSAKGNGEEKGKFKFQRFQGGTAGAAGTEFAEAETGP